jgi:Heterokaryon incompatibility protein (HET)
MRLINTETLELHEFFDAAVPRHAILSHTWGPEEVTFQDWLYARHQNPPRWGWVYIEEEVDKVKAKLGYIKIANACRQASTDHLSWIWVDTNCIDKTSSAELSEAINSMYRWYEKAEVCYTFLADVPPSSPEECAEPRSKFRCSRWFTRGWTLQELIAPLQLFFFSDSWTPICEKREIASTIQDITNIPCGIITEPRHLSCGHASIAEIMSWASTRTTARTEDMAYCLMGLLGVNMPLLYGEGRDAFLRLQLEIIQKARDVTFLAWKPVLFQPRESIRWERFLWTLRSSETFALGPEAFYFSHCFHQTDSPPPEPGELGIGHWRTDGLMSLRISNLGLSLNLPLVETLLPCFQYAILPFAQHGRRLWMPLLRSGGVHTRVEFPSVTLSVLDAGYTARETEITQPIYYSAARHHAAPTMSHLTSALDHGRRFLANILLAFPAGLHGYKRLQQFPPTKYSNPVSSLVLRLHIDDDLPSIAYGAIEFEKILGLDSGETTDENSRAPLSSRLAVFFAVDLGDADDLRPRRWTCRDISTYRFENSYLFYSLYEDALELRARTQLVNLSDPSFDELVPSTWERRSLLKGKGAQAGCGIILLDEFPRDISNTEFVLRRGDNDGHGCHITSEGGSIPRETAIVAQIIFPGQGYEERSSLHGSYKLLTGHAEYSGF